MDSKQGAMKKLVMSQDEIKEILIPLLREKGKIYAKFKPVLARKAVPGEQILTRTKDGLETQNVAKKGDIVVKNKTDAGEEYVLSKSKFSQRYRWNAGAEDGYDEFLPIGKIIAIELAEPFPNDRNFWPPFHFMAAWGEPMVAKRGDYLACPPDFSEIYRIARKEFFETYQPANA